MIRAFKIHFVLMAIIHIGFVNGDEQSCDLSYAPIDQAFEYNLTQSINTTADPCVDFYAYSCGNYNGYADGDESVQEITQYLDYKYNAKLIELMTAAESICDDNNGCFKSAEDCLEQTFREKTHTYYKACVGENSINFVKYFDELQQIKWPLRLKANETCSFGSKDFWQTLGQLQGYNWNKGIIRHEIIADKNGTLNIMLEPATAPNEFPNDKAIEGVLKALKVDNASEVVLQLRDSEGKWLEILQNNNSSSSGDTYLELRLEDLARQFPYLSSYLQHLLNQKVNQVDKIALKNLEFFKYFHDNQWPAEDWQQQINYLMLHFLFYLFEDSTSNFTATDCIKDVRNKLDLAINYMYYDEVLHQDYCFYKRALMDLNDKMKTVIRHLLDENKLKLGSQQINDLKNILFNMKLNLGNLPVNPLTNETIENFYMELAPLDKGNYFKNHLLLLQHRFRMSLLYQEDLNFYISSDNSLASSSSLFYVAKQNLVVIPFANLQYPMYNYTLPPLYQLSLMGFIMAHEMGHAFDSNGLIATLHNSILQHDLYMDSLQCMQNQRLTKDIDERIADLLAERVAYRTYERFYNAGNNINWQREFFLNMAQFFCNKGDLEFIEHDADAVRLHQIVRNSEGFAKAFNCTFDSPMNPQKKCLLF